MKKFLLSIVFIAALCPATMSAQDTDLCFWNAISMKKSVAEKWTVGVRAEHRANNNASTTQQYYLRPMVDFKILPWMTATAQADFAWMSSGFNIRVMPQVVFSYKFDGFNFSLRQRLQATWKQPNNSWDFLFRTKAQARYTIPGTPLSPQIAVEPYYMQEFARTRYYAGVNVSVTKNLSILMEYVYQDHYNKSIDDNVLWLTFSVKL